MSHSRAPAAPARRLTWRLRNVICLAAAIVSLIVGYVLLDAGATEVAAVLLVLGYCVLLPLGIAL